MSSLAWLARIAGAGALALAMLGCDQPTGIVLNVQGLESTDRLFLAVGDSASRNQANQSGQRRFVQGPEPMKIEYQAPFPASFEIFLENDHLLSKPELALMIDATSGPETSPVIKRDSFEVSPESGTLLEVRLAPRDLGSGQWVCWGRARRSQDPGVVIELDVQDTDCDRDGWPFDKDPDDADPLATGTPMWALVDNQCKISVGAGRPPVFEPPACEAECLLSQIGECLGNKPRRHCKINKSSETIKVVNILEPETLPSNPNWELVKLGPMGASAYFEPSERSPGEWSVTFQLGALDNAWFVLRDRDGGFSQLVHVQRGDDPFDGTCDFSS
jgi:hypothetical protein